MENMDKLTKNAAREIAHSSKISPTEAGQTNTQKKTDALQVDAINQVFSLFRINYHNQFYAAYSDSDTLNQAKRLWLQSLAPFDAQTILKAAKTVIEDSEYLPTLHRFLGFCDQFAFALPTVRDAFLEACTARAPYENNNWSHNLAYHAGKAAGWSFLRGQPEAKTFRVFSGHYDRLARQLREGQALALPPTRSEQAAETTPPSEPLNQQEKIKRLAKLRERLALD